MVRQMKFLKEELALTDEPDLDRYCPYCHGMGSYWDERFITFYENHDSYKTTENAREEFVSDLIYLEHTVDVTSDDYIILVRTDFDGNVIMPLERISFYKTYNVKKYRGDYGRIEYIMVRTREEQQWSTWYGIHNRQLGNNG